VIAKELPPFEFKIHLFLDSKDQSEVSMEPREITDILTKKLMAMGATNIQDSFLKDHKGVS